MSRPPRSSPGAIRQKRASLSRRAVGKRSHPRSAPEAPPTLHLICPPGKSKTMLTSDLVLARREGDRVAPFRLDPEESANLRLAEALIELFTRHVGQPREVLNAALADFIGVSPAFRIPRGLVKLLA